MAKIGYALIEHFAVAVERRTRPELCGRAVIVGGYPYERKPVYDASAEVMALGVKPGLPLRQAEQLCPDAVFLPPNVGCYEETNEAFLAIVERFSPTVAPDAPGSAYFEASGMERLLGADGPRRIAEVAERGTGLMVKLGFGPTRFVAYVAARLSRPGAPLAVSDAVAWLTELAVEHLPGNEEFYDRLRLLGIRTIGQFMGLPASELMEQFGPAGVAAYDLARGREAMPLVPRPRPAVLRQGQEFEPPLRAGAGLAKAIGLMTGALAAELRQRYQACQTVILRLALGEGKEGVTLEQTAELKKPAPDVEAIAAAALRLAERIVCHSEPQPSASLKSKLRRSEESLEGSYGEPVDITITAIEIIATGLIGQGGSQLGLFDMQRQKQEAIQGATAEVERRFGNRLKRAKLIAPINPGVTPPFVLRDWSLP